MNGGGHNFGECSAEIAHFPRHIIQPQRAEIDSDTGLFGLCRRSHYRLEQNREVLIADRERAHDHGGM